MHPLHVIRYFKDSAVPRWRKWVGLLAVLYVLSPIDVIPDVLPVIGWLDDLGVIGLALGFVTRDVAKYEAARRNVQVVDAEPSPK